MHRAYHALPPLTTREGKLVNAVYGFTSMLLKVLADIKPDYVLATFDLKGPTFRHEEYKEYKAKRVKAPDEFYEQIPLVKDVVRAFNIPIYEKEGYEADDVIGTLVNQSEKLENDVKNIIVTGDLDTLQLVSEKTNVFTLKQGINDTVLYDDKKVLERFSLEPAQISDLKGLKGDASDNIPGVKGIGEKTAIELLIKYKSLGGVYKNLSKIKESVRAKLESEKAQGFFSKKLATIVKDAPVNLELDKCEASDFDYDRVVALFRKLNFYSLLKRIPQSDKLESVPKEEREAHQFSFSIVDDKNENKFFSDLEKQTEMTLVCHENGALALNFSGENFFVPQDKIEKVKDFLENPKILKNGYDLKYALGILKKYGIELRGLNFDVLVAAYLANAGSNLDLQTLILAEFGERIEETKTNEGQLGLNLEPREEIAQNLCRQAFYIGKLKDIYVGKLEHISQDQLKSKKWTIIKMFSEIEMPLIEVLQSMEETGVKLDKVVLEGISRKLNSRISNLEKKIYSLSKTEFNINSPSQLANVLFNKLKIPTADIKKIKTGYSTAASELDKLKSSHKIIEEIQSYRELFKLKTTYVDTLPQMTDANSRLHTTFNQTITTTGRLSSSEPNLQNIPTRTDIGKMIRTAFEAEKGSRLLSADYSQIDLRVVAHTSGDKKLIEAFHKGQDIHKITAAEIYKVPISKVTDTMRSSVKELNFGIIYGMSVFGFSQAAGIDRDKAKEFIDNYMKQFPSVGKYIRVTKEFAKKYGYVETELGRRRYIPEINSPNFQVAAAGERMAINMPIQGMSADIMKLAMLETYKYIGRFGNKARIILQIHDELIFEVADDFISEVGKNVKEIMERVYKLKVPLVVNIKVGDNWGEL